MPKPSKKQEEIPTKHNQKTQTHKNICCFKSFFLNLFSKNKGDNKRSFYDTIKNFRLTGKKIPSYERNILNNSLSFASKTVEDVMVPRSDISAVRKDISLEGLSIKMTECPFTRILVYDDTLDNVIGFVHIKDILKTLLSKANFQIDTILRTPIIAAPSMKLIDLLVEMQLKRTHMAIVIDEYGGTDGIVTIEDIIEEIVGRIDDEYDTRLESDSYTIVNPSTILSHARVEVEALEKILGIKLKKEDDEFDTIGGLVLAKVGNVPSIGTKIDISDIVELEVIDASTRTLKQVKLKLKNAQHLFANPVS
jgi:magnesium and cobalt transporter